MKCSASTTIVIAAIATSAIAAGVGKYTNWPNSPLGYFMTKSERAQWSRLSSEEEAGRFIKGVVAARGPKFAEDVAAAAKATDEHLTVAGRLGSQTIRGRIVILLGPPSSFTISHWQKDADTMPGTHMSPWRPQTVGVTSSPAMVSEARTKYCDDYRFVYARERLPSRPENDREIVVAVNPLTGEDRILDARAAREVSELLDAAAEARLAATTTRR
jgi:hypothetical protein